MYVEGGREIGISIQLRHSFSMVTVFIRAPTDYFSRKTLVSTEPQREDGFKMLMTLVSNTSSHLETFEAFITKGK